MVDASVGGKTGINFNGLKNEIGAFAPANSVLIVACHQALSALLLVSKAHEEPHSFHQHAPHQPCLLYTSQ